MEHLSTATVNAIVKQIKDLQKNPAEGITVRSFSFFGSREMRARDRERERERETSEGSCFWKLWLLLLLLLPLSSSSSAFSNATLAFYSPKFTIHKRNKNTGKTDRIERARRVRGNSRSREHAVRKWIVQDEVGAPVGLPDVGAERVLFDENFPPEHPTTVRGDLREHVETGLEARFRFATRVDGHSVLDD
jgi:hypothetical protein